MSYIYIQCIYIKIAPWWNNLQTKQNAVSFIILYSIIGYSMYHLPTNLQVSLTVAKASFLGKFDNSGWKGPALTKKRRSSSV